MNKPIAGSAWKDLRGCNGFGKVCLHINDYEIAEPKFSRIFIFLENF